MEMEPAEGAEVIENDPDDMLRDSYNFHEEVDQAMGADIEDDGMDDGDHEMNVLMDILQTLGVEP